MCIANKAPEKTSITHLLLLICMIHWWKYRISSFDTST